MKILVTGSSGHLGEGLVRTLRQSSHEVIGLDIVASPFTTHVGSIADEKQVAACVAGVDAILHTATLHKPHIGSHSPQAFVDVCRIAWTPATPASTTSGSRIEPMMSVVGDSRRSSPIGSNPGRSRSTRISASPRCPALPVTSIFTGSPPLRCR
jgi:hypothetical protein